MAAPPVPRPRRPRRFTVGIAMAAVGVTIAAGLSAVAISQSGGSNPQQASTFSPFNAQNGFNSGGRSGQSVPSIDGSGGSTSTSSGQATAAQQVGVVDINTVIDYGSERAAGTGMVLTSNGEILTNNHVIDGATTIQVTVVSTGKTYTASVVGDDPSDDVAVLQLSRASGLATANLGDSSKVAVGDAVTAVGNAGGTGGTPSSATGTVTAVNQSITASDQGGSDSENLTGVIQINANIEAGDSGGPLYASNGTVVGIDTAASTSDSTGTTQGFAIPIAKATSIASQITSGNWSSTIHRGATAFLGVQIASGNSGGSVDQGATIAGVVDNSAAANAGLQEGDTITGIDGTTISSPSDLSSTMANYQPGQHVTVTWTDGSGQSQSASVTLGSGPAD
jgi:S1-C subfamily serine protease